ncbi:endonuclease/exonuclease/phosphatase family protein [Zhouia spongiae]|uniref:Endonuclease/exonuclease/phosphatase family protein n=1 Tax=Zhouia spongiae TaxID=2202721 RepID=A0ABY3YQU3_9FLAO|nr:endonuclease/exonuclease/phosphatase family protein [Zhouia spongiae]UNZ00089.1 endonuclease/exonuclease/phosphatase family protein [Zhouia spongiae]
MTVFYLFIFYISYAQERNYRIRTIAFYNVENLFDTIDDSLKYDESRTPEGKDRWTKNKYNDKVEKIAFTISRIGRELTKTPPDIIGLCEVENQGVLNDLIRSRHLQKYNYGIIHFDSPDVRGIDVALIYKHEIFIPDSFQNYYLKLNNENNEREYTRDQLLVTGRLDGEKIHILVNHWPSRRGGELKSSHKREAAARLNRKIIDSLLNLNQSAKIITMGDFNDDPTNRSIKTILNAKGKIEIEGQLYNPMLLMHEKGYGSLAYRDQWNLFDQIILSASLTEKNREHYTFWKAGIFNKAFLTSLSGKYKGYPFRSYANGNYTGGYSDHFPVYVYLIKKAP